jgi:F-box and WD-40 domain protein CDC4
MGDTTIRFWNLTTNECKYVLQGHTLSVWGLKVVASDVLASSSIDATINFWNIILGEFNKNFDKSQRLYLLFN